MLENKYYIIKSVDNGDDGYVFRISLVEGHEIYNGHFPGNPVSPGVCSIEMIRECAEKVVGHGLLISSISRCRFVAVLTPSKGDNLTIQISVSQMSESRYKVASSLTNGSDVTYVVFSGELTTK